MGFEYMSARKSKH